MSSADNVAQQLQGLAIGGNVRVTHANGRGGERGRGGRGGRGGSRGRGAQQEPLSPPVVIPAPAGGPQGPVVVSNVAPPPPQPGSPPTTGAGAAPPAVQIGGKTVAPPVMGAGGTAFMQFPGTVLGTMPHGSNPPAFAGTHLQIGGAAGPGVPAPRSGAPAPQQQHQQQRGGYGGQQGSGHQHQRGGRGGFDRPRPARKPFEEDDDSGEEQDEQQTAPSTAGMQPPLPPPSAPVVDHDLVRQLLSRYESQEENSDAGMKAPPGLLDADEALRVVSENDVTFIVTDTGTGKSTLLPKLLMEKGFKVASSQPRRTATVNLATRVASLRNEALGPNVGYLVRGDHIGDKNTRLMYMTSYTLFLYIVSHPDDLSYTHFIIDEFHERQPDVEVMLALLKLARKVTGQKFKIVLMSASAEVQDWQAYFDGLSVGIYSTCKPRYPVYEYYQEEICRMVGAAFNPAEPTPVVGSLALKNNLFLVERMLEFLAKHAQPEHSILVFLPGRTVVEHMAKFISSKLASQLEAIPWYRDVELERIDAAIKRRNDTRKKVYLATDIAEVSITLPDVVFVIDSGTTKKPRIDPNVRNSVVFPPLELLWNSKSGVAQRKGRIGRVSQGFFLCLVPETHLPLLQDMEPQIANSRIDELSLHILQFASNPLAVFNLCRQNTKRECVQLSTNILVDNGCALPMNHPHAEDEAVEHPDCVPWRAPVMADPRNKELSGAAFVTTTKGKVAQRLPLSISCSLIVTNGLLLNMDSVSILTAAVVASGTPFYAMSDNHMNPEQRRKQVEQVSDTMAQYAHASPSDVLAAVVATLEYKLMNSRGLAELDEEQWCTERSLSRTRLQNIVKLEAQVKEQLGDVVTFLDVTDPEELLKSVRASPKRVTWLAASSFLERAIFVEYEAAEAQRRRKAGRSLFLGFDALADFQVPSCVTWKPGNIIIPTILQARYDKLFGTFAMRFTPQEFNALVLLLNYAVYYDDTPRQDPPPPQMGGMMPPPPGVPMPPQMMPPPPPSPQYMVFGVELHQRKLLFKVGIDVAKAIIEFREGLSMRARLQRLMVREKISLADTDQLMTAAREAGLLPMPPQQLGERLSQMLVKLMDGITANPGAIEAAAVESFMPTRVSMILSSKSSSQPFVAVEPMEQQTLPLPGNDMPQRDNDHRRGGRGGRGGGQRGGRGGGGGRGGRQFPNGGRGGGGQHSSPPAGMDSPAVASPLTPAAE